MKSDERLLARALVKRMKTGERPYVRFVVNWLGMNDKRAGSILEKWYDKGWYDCGVSIMAGWLTAKGLAAMAAMEKDDE